MAAELQNVREFLCHVIGGGGPEHLKKRKNKNKQKQNQHAYYYMGVFNANE